MLKIKNKKLLIVGLILMIFGGMSFLFNRKGKIQGNVEKINAVKQDLIFEYSFSAKVESKKETLIYSNIIGEVERVNYFVGDNVKKGDILVELSETSLLDIKSNIEKAKINVRQKREDLNTLIEVHKLGGVSNQELNRMKDALKVAELELSTLLSNNKHSNFIKSTISGTIVESNVDENFKIDPTKYLFKIVDTDNLKIVAEVANSKVKYLSVGDPVTITSESLKDNIKIEGKISEIGKISYNSKQFNDTVTNISINLDENTGLKPGDAVEINIKYDELKGVLTLPFVYVTFENEKSYVYVIEKDIVVKKEVKLGKTNNILYEIKSGITGEDIILNNISKIYKEGDKIK